MDFLKVSSSPHVRHEDTTRTIMFDVILALLPAMVWAAYVFGIRVIAHCIISVASCVAFEYLYRLIAKKPQSVGDLSAVVTGLLIAFCLPVTAPLWYSTVGAAFAIIIVKQLYGGIGKNVVNPALAARVFLFICFPTGMTSFTKPLERVNSLSFSLSSSSVDAIASATPLESLRNGLAPSVEPFRAFIGVKPGSIGEVSVLLLLAGAAFLISRKVIKPHIPLAYLLTVAVIAYIFPPMGVDAVSFVVYELCSGGLVLAACFMATDYVTSPVTNTGKLIFGAGCGLITMMIRYFGGYPEGVSFAILIMNLLVGYIDKFTAPRVFGGGKKHENK